MAFSVIMNHRVNLHFKLSTLQCIAKLSVHHILFAANLVLVAALCTLPAVVLLLATVLSLAHQPAHKLPVTRL